MTESRKPGTDTTFRRRAVMIRLGFLDGEIWRQSRFSRRNGFCHGLLGLRSRGREYLSVADVGVLIRERAGWVPRADGRIRSRVGRVVDNDIDLTVAVQIQRIHRAHSGAPEQRAEREIASPVA